MFCDWSDNFFKERKEISSLSNMEEEKGRARGTTTGRVTRNSWVISCVLQPSFTLFIHYIRRKIEFCLKCFTIVAVFQQLCLGILCADIQRESNIIKGSRNTINAAYTSSKWFLRGHINGRAYIRGGLFTGFLLKLQNVIIYRIHFNTFEGALFIRGGRLIIFSFTGR